MGGMGYKKWKARTKKGGKLIPDDWSSKRKEATAHSNTWCAVCALSTDIG